MRNFKAFHCSIAAAILAAASMSVLGGPSAGQNPGPAEQVLQREHQYSAALLRGDIRLLASVLADTFVDTSESGILRDKRQLLEIIARQTPPTSITETARKIQIYGDTAVVTVKFAVKGTDHGKSYESAGRATDVWIRRNGSWYCVAAHSSAIS